MNILLTFLWTMLPDVIFFNPLRDIADTLFSPTGLIILAAVIVIVIVSIILIHRRRKK